MTLVANPKVSVVVEGKESSQKIPLTPPIEPTIYEFFDDSFWESVQNARWDDPFQVWRRNLFSPSSFQIAPTPVGGNSGWQLGFRPDRVTLEFNLAVGSPGIFSAKILSTGGATLLEIELVISSPLSTTILETHDLVFPDNEDIASLEVDLTGDNATSGRSLSLIQFIVIESPGNTPS